MNEDQTTTAVATDEDKEWAQAANDFAANSGKIPEVDADKPDNKAKDPKDDIIQEDGGKDDTEPKETEEEKTAREAKEAEEAAKNDGEVDPNKQAREQRGIQRELAADETAMKEDIRKEMFSEVPTVLQDADGDQIRTIEDVQKLMNPNTGKPFTEEEAGSWLLQAQQHLNTQLQELEKQIEQIAETNISLKDQSDSIKGEYGELLKANPNNIREKIWVEYEKTLKKDEKSGIIIEAPVSLESFYRAALAPYVELAKQLEAQAEAETKDSKVEADKAKTQNQTDRADITSGGKSDTRDDEEKEWDKAAKSYYNS